MLTLVSRATAQLQAMPWVQNNSTPSPAKQAEQPVALAGAVDRFEKVAPPSESVRAGQQFIIPKPRFINWEQVQKTASRYFRASVESNDFLSVKEIRQLKLRNKGVYGG